jgi:hypothetical protein
MMNSTTRLKDICQRRGNARALRESRLKIGTDRQTAQSNDLQDFVLRLCCRLGLQELADGLNLGEGAQVSVSSDNARRS